MASTATEPKGSTATYQFGPLERRGLILGFTTGQVILVAGGAIGGVFLVVGGAAPLGMGVLLAGLGLAFWPVGGHTVHEWVPIVGAFWLRRLCGAGRWRNDAPLLGHVGAEPPWPHLPAHLAGHVVLRTVGPAGSLMGVLRAGSTYTAVLAVRPQAFALCDSEEQARRLAGWGATLAGLAREGTPVSRLQWLERTAPADDGELVRAARAGLSVPETHPLASSYLQLVEAAGPATQAHEAYVAVQIDANRARRLVKAAGGGDSGALTVLRRELATLASGLAGAEVTVEGTLPPRALARAIRVAFDPGARAGLAYRASVDPERAGVAPAACWPSATEEEWASYRADDSHHAVYWVEEWPRTPVRPDFLSPLLLGTRCARVVSVTVEPLSPAAATRQVERARTQDVADEEMRQRGGFLSTARRRRQAEGTLRREEELADGHADCRFSGYVAVSAPDEEALESACGEVEQLAQQCRLQLTRLRGQQEEAFAWTLPLCRGLR
jgi:Putative type VII ESX secretion system translocon, EccE